jgi:hypothetical protein
LQKNFLEKSISKKEKEKEKEIKNVIYLTLFILYDTFICKSIK